MKKVLSFLILGLAIFCYASKAHASSYVVTATGTGSWTVPAGVTSVEVQLWGAGGGGAGDSSYAGTPGAYVVTSSLSVTAGNSITYNIGAGGTGATASTTAGTGGTGYNSGGNGSVGTTNSGGGGGGSTSVVVGGVTYIASGGAGGGGNAAATTATSTTGGTGGAGTGTTKGAGGGGGSGTAGGNASGASAGAGGTGGTLQTGTNGLSSARGGTSAGATGNGTNGTTGTGSGGASAGADAATGTNGSSSPISDSGGGGGYGSTGSAGNGGQPAAGGGSAESAVGTGGIGGAGELVITYTSSVSHFALVQNVTSTAVGGSKTITVAVSPTGAGDLLVLFYGSETAPTSTLSASYVSSTLWNGTNGGAWIHPSTCQNFVGTSYLDCSYILSSNANATSVTITFNGPANSFDIYADFLEYSYASGDTVAFDAVNNGYQSFGGTSAVAPSLASSTGSNDLLLQAVNVLTNTSTAINGGFTRQTINIGAATAFAFTLADYQNTNSYSTPPIWTISTSAHENMAAISFEEVPGSSSSSTAPLADTFFMSSE